MNNAIQLKAADAFASAHGYSASVVRLRNTSDVSIEYIVSGGGAVELAAGASAVVDVAALTSEISVRRTDLSTTPVNVMLEFGLDPDEAYVFAVENATGGLTSVASSDITDAGTAGIAAIQSATPAALRTAAGFGGTVTVAQLNAAGADARSAMFYCSDCLTVNGPGSLVAWCGRTQTWRTLDDCLLATTDFAEWVNDFIKNSNSSELVGSKAAMFCRTSAGAGADQISGSGGSWRQYPSAIAQRYSIMALTNTAATNYARFYSQGIAFAQSPQAKPMVFSGVRGLTLGSIGTGFSVRLGIGAAPNASLSAAENSVVYDKGNVLGGLNAGGESAWLGCIRSGSVNLAGSGSLGVGPTLDTEEDLCVIRNGDSVSIYRNGVAVGSGTANAYDIQTMSPFFIIANDGTSVMSQRAIMRGFCLGYYMP